MKTDPPLTRRGFSGQDRSRKVLPELVTQIFSSWNLIGRFLHGLEHLRRVA
jgi:hypothetical protein